MKSKNNNSLFLSIFVIIFIIIILYLQQNRQKETPLAATQITPTIGQRTKISNCVIQGPFPDKACTPGAIFIDATAAQICVSGYTKTVRNVPASLKREVYAEYGISHHSSDEYEVDHYIPLEIGGNNDIANLFPEAAEPKPGFHEKDKVENYLHQEVCAGRMPLADAQKKIADNWLEIYNQIR